MPDLLSPWWDLYRAIYRVMAEVLKRAAQIGQVKELAECPRSEPPTINETVPSREAVPKPG